MSPGTNAADGTVFNSPSRSTVEFAAVISRSAATALSALFSWTKPRTPLNRTTAPITIASTGGPAAPSTTQARTEMAIAASSR